MKKIKNKIFGQGKPKVCVSLLFDETYKEQLKQLEEKKFDVLECRIDYFQDLYDVDTLCHRLQEIYRSLEGPLLLVTFRSLKEGGQQELEGERYIALYQRILESHCLDLIDIEFTRGPMLVKTVLKMANDYGIFTILSYHDFEKTRISLALFEQMAIFKPDFIKIACMPKSQEDVVSLLLKTHRMHQKVTPCLITMSMGESGKISRVTGEIFGSCMTFGFVQKNSAPGQIDLDHLHIYLDCIHQAIDE